VPLASHAFDVSLLSLNRGKAQSEPTRAPYIHASPVINRLARSFNIPTKELRLMTDETEHSRASLIEAFDELIQFYRLLEKENELLREQLRRHAVGELQIRKTERTMLRISGAAAHDTQERLRALLAAREL
jgi:hypothetical protein